MDFGWRRRPRSADNGQIEHSGYVDVHCHILPGLDDGARTIEDSLALAQEAAANGVSDIIATPHLNPDLFDFSPEKSQAAFETLAAAIQEAKIPVTLHLGAEIRAASNIVGLLGTAKMPSLAGGRHVLLEFPFDRIPVFARDLVFKMQTAGYTPVLAHPERNTQIQKDISVLEPYIEAGVLAQINSASLTGQLGKTAQKTAISLLGKGWVHIMASDSHGAGRRGPNFKEAVAAAAKYLGVTGAQALVRENPRRVLKTSETLRDPN